MTKDGRTRLLVEPTRLHVVHRQRVRRGGDADEAPGEPEPLTTAELTASTITVPSGKRGIPGWPQ